MNRQAAEIAKKVESGEMTLNEARKAFGLAPLADPSADSSYLLVGDIAIGRKGPTPVQRRHTRDTDSLMYNIAIAISVISLLLALFAALPIR